VSGAISSSVLLSWFSSFYGGSGTDPTGLLTSSASASASTSTTSASTTSTVQYAPTPPWQQSSQPSQSKLVRQAESGAQLFNVNAAKIDLPGASADYKKLFALYSGLNSLYAIATQAGGKNVTSLQLSQMQNAFNNGFSQLQTYLGQTTFSKLKLTGGVTEPLETSTATTPQQASSYTTAPLNVTGDSSAVVPAFQGNVQFDINVSLGGGTPVTVPIDLNDLGSAPRTLSNVISYINAQLQAAGTFVSVQTSPNPAIPDTTSVNGKTITLSAGTETWGLTFNTSPVETVSLSAPQTGAAVYIGQVVGNQTSTTSSNGQTVAADAQSQLLKFNASGDGVTGPTTPAYGAPTQLSTTSLGSSVNSIQATALAPDGSVYVLADVNATTSGAAAAGGQDVALQKYDSAGHLIFSTDLGSASSATGLSLAVSADGSQVAVAGEVTGSLTAGQTVADPTGSNSFVSVFDSEGNQVWTQQTDGLTPNQANAVAFGADGSVYVTGQSQTTTAVQGPQGPANSYLQVYSSTGAQVSTTQIATGGANLSNAIAVDGSDVYVAGTQNGDAVVTEYDVSNPAQPTVVATRNLGDLQSGNIVGLAVQNGTVYVAGNTTNGALNAGTVTNAASGSGINAFAATLSTGLAPSSSDAIAYYGGAGSTIATAATVANGDVYLTGSVTGALPNEPAIGTTDGFVAALNVGAGTVDYAQRFTGQDGQVAPTSIAVDPTGESVLDQLGLPQGVIDGPVSDLVTSNTPVQAGDSFGISVNGAPPTTITVQSTDTFASLAAEIAQATGFNVNATTSPGPNGSTALELQPANSNDTISLVDGPSGSDALPALGLKPGIIAQTQYKNSETQLKGSGEPVYGLGLPATLDLSSTADIKTAQVQLAGAISVVEDAYQNLKNAATPAAVLALQKAQASGSTPKYLSNEIASYQTALTRLSIGSSDSSSSGSSLSISSLF
jgi:hypothetical protein